MSERKKHVEEHVDEENSQSSNDACKMSLLSAKHSVSSDFGPLLYKDVIRLRQRQDQIRVYGP